MYKSRRLFAAFISAATLTAALLVQAAPAHAGPPQPPGESHRAGGCVTIDYHRTWKVDACATFNHNGAGAIQVLGTIAMRDISTGRLVDPASLTVVRIQMETTGGHIAAERGRVSRGDVSRLVVGSLDVNGSVFTPCNSNNLISLRGIGTWADFDARYPDRVTMGTRRVFAGGAIHDYTLPC